MISYKMENDHFQIRSHSFKWLYGTYYKKKCVYKWHELMHMFTKNAFY